MLERDIEKALKYKIEMDGTGAKCLKFVSPGYSGVPDRIILLPDGVAVFVELKKPGKTERQRQRYVQASLRRLGFTVFSGVDSMERVDDVVAFCRERVRAAFADRVALPRRNIRASDVSRKLPTSYESKQNPHVQPYYPARAADRQVNGRVQCEEAVPDEIQSP